MPPSSRLILVDGTAYVYRAFHAIKNLSTRGGLPTNAVYGFATMFLRLLREQEPEYIAVVFDPSGETHRDALYAAYKANRPKTPESLHQQVPLIKRFLEACRIPMIERQGFEADDVLATLAKRAEARGYHVDIFSGDKDMCQIVSERIHVYREDYTRRQYHVYDPERVYRRYGVQPSQIPDYLGIVGDSTDNIPGVKGVGAKSAPKLLEQFGTLENLLDHLEAVPPPWRTKFEDGADLARLSKQLATLCTDVPIDVTIESLRWPGRDDQKLFAFFKEMEFHSLLRELELAPDKVPTDYRTILTEVELEALVSQLRDADAFSVDLETTSINALDAEIVGFAIALKPHQAYYIPTGHRYLGAPVQLSEERVLEAFRPYLEDPSIGKIGQNLKYDLKVLKNHGIGLQGIQFDTLIASYLLNPSASGHSLDNLALRYLNRRITPIEDLIGKGAKQGTMDQVTIEKAAAYACEDADIPLQLKPMLAKELEDLGLLSIFSDMEIPLIPVLAAMELAGIKVDVDYLRQVSRQLEGQLQEMSAQIYEVAGEEFNINSTKQLGRILFEKLKLPPKRRTKTGYSTDERTLRSLAEQHPLPQLVLDYRQLATLKSTFVDALPTHIHPRTGRVHTTFNQAVASTGRLSSSDPNLQNIPIRTEAGRELRRAFIAEPGYLLMSADYSQIELRVLAHISGDPNLVAAFREGEDIHARTAALIFGHSPDEVPPEARRQAKTINFGIIYGLSAFSLARSLGISVAEAQAFIDNYFATYPRVREYLDRTIEQAQRQGYVTTLLGRRRYVPEIQSQDHNQREFGKRSAINAPIQGTAADMIKLAMLRVSEYLHDRRCQTRMLLQVHDELVFEVPEGELDEVMRDVKHLMETAYPLSVPVKVDIQAGPNWLEAK